MLRALSSGELAEARLREWAPREKPSADLLTEHQYYLAPLLPPPTFLAEPSTAPEGLLRIDGIRSVLHAAGRTLGGTDEVTERRWEHLADGQQLTQLCAVLVHDFIRPRGFPKEEQLALTRLCLPGGCGPAHAPPTPRPRPAHAPPTPLRVSLVRVPSLPPPLLSSSLLLHAPSLPHPPSPCRSKSWLAPGTRRWAALRALAQIHAQRPDESEQACIRRCCRGCAPPPPPLTNRALPRPARGSPPRDACGDGRDAWLAATELFKDCLPGVFLQTMLQVLADPFFTPGDLRVDHHMLDPGGAREADLPALRADCEAFCTVHPCETPACSRRSLAPTASRTPPSSPQRRVAPRPAPDLANPLP